MDPVTQTLLGAAAAAAVTWRSLRRRALLPGAIGGEIADADVFVPPIDPALPMELHRHFTHSLAFIAIGGALAAAPLMLLPSWRRSWKPVLAAAIAGCATHAPLDACTSYGTHLLWPFSGGRVSWDVVSIIDPIFTAVLLAGVVWTACRGSPVPARLCLAAALAYLGLGAVQHGRARAAQQALAARRGHEIDRGRVMPTLGNLVLWRSLYQSEGALHADALRLPLGPAAAGPGDSRPSAGPDVLPAGVPQSTPRIERLRRAFAHFADGYVYAEHDDGRVVLVDARYSLEPGGFVPLWGLEIRATGDVAGAGGGLDARMVSPGLRRGGTIAELWRDVRGGGDGFRAIEGP